MGRRKGMGMGSRVWWLVVLAALWCAPGSAAASPAEDLVGRAEAGDPVAQYELGVAFAKGDGVRADDPAAAAWFARAADGGHTEAMFALGMLYATGAGVALDPVQAHKWLHLCVRFSEGEARKVALSSRNAVTAEMTPDQVVDAQEQASRWMEQRRTASR